MNSPLRTSKIRFIAGGAMFLAAAGVMLFVLPDASQQKLQKQNASNEAEKALVAQHGKLAVLKAEEARLTGGKKRIEGLLGSMSGQTVGSLQWQLSQRLYALAQKHGVRLQSLKYGTPTREGAKGTDLEILDVEFTVSGVYQSLKPFMLGVENTEESRLPFAVINAKLEESPDGARMNVTLRAFRRSQAPPAEGS